MKKKIPKSTKIPTPPSSTYTNHLSPLISVSIEPKNKDTLVPINIDVGLFEDLEDLKDDENPTTKPLTDKEKLVLSAFFGGMSLDQAVKSAGYKAKHRQSRTIVGKRILEKYCTSTDDKQKMLRDIGQSEVSIALSIAHMSVTARSETVRLNALKVLATMHGLLKDIDEQAPSIPIRFVFEGGAEGEEQPEDRQGPHDKPFTKPVSIIK